SPTTNKRLKIETELSPEVENLFIDPAKLKQVLYNYLSNAIKFTPEGGEITIEAGVTQERLFLRVTDTGMGIPDNEIDSLRGAFIRGSHAVRSAVEGAGLGLSIVNGLVRLHDGELSISSEVGAGTAITVSFPPTRTIGLQPTRTNDLVQQSASQRKLIALTS
ncbi:MAG TPA: ATP-binding protein, partial [Aestuariivirgaceae bacterium]|nr:ATP-binding protein [Aestuariivirgaceae bacterium]